MGAYAKQPRGSTSAGAVGIADQEPIAQYLFLNTGEAYWLAERHVMLGEQRICPLPTWALTSYSGQEVRIGTVIKALNQARRIGWGYARHGFSHFR